MYCKDIALYNFVQGNFAEKRVRIDFALCYCYN